MKRPTQILLIAAVAVGAAAAGYLTRQGLSEPDSAARLDPATAEHAGTALMALELPDLDGHPQALEQWRGNVLVVNFWATWCPPCIKEIPEFSAVSRRHADAPVRFVGISIDQAEAVRRFQRDFEVPYPLLIGTPNTLTMAKSFGNSVQALPFTVILDQAGEVRHIKLGTLNEAELEGKIRALLGS